FMYASHTSREVQGFETGGRLETLMFGVQGKYLYQRFTRVKPYAVLGFGLVRNNMRNGRFRFDTDIGDYELDTRLYMNGGFGLQYQLRPSVSLFLEGGLDIMLTRDAQINMDGETLRDPETDRPLEIGSNYYFIDFKAGVNFRFGGED
nr:porin family protein [candidate division Zixibacteria bacterium]NIR66525.1 porin family protein [candidate division Zixibacteria bacterium]NIS18219.1 porin family protein [candidate division Zixibacteria bacterium]NIS48087.1 porin family protein [candidate division Zixibacteria bacterium]NIU16208.1 porin family protein [candidate division Zixibacteria bacterium]